MSVETYLHSQLATTGFCILDHTVVMRLRPDLFNYNGMICSDDLIEARKHHKLNPSHVTRQHATLQGIDHPVEVLARSTIRLAERIEEITGFKVTAMAVPAPEIKSNVVQPLDTAEALRKARLEKLHKLATQEPPAHVCHMRTEILNARAELERLEPKPVPVETKAHEADTQGDNPESAMDRAKELILDMLEAGPTDAAGILAVAEGDGISERTMQRAAESLGVVKTKAGFSGGWMWALPEEQAA